MPVTIKPLSDVLGAEVSGADFSKPLSAEDSAALRAAFLDAHLVCLRAEPLTPDALLSLSAVFGEAKLHVLERRRREDVPEVAIMDSTYQTPEAKPADLAKDRKSGWHTDDSYLEEPAAVTVLHGIEIPDSGGETRFANTRRAYEDLSAEEQARIDGLQAVHAYDTMRAPARAAKRTKKEEAATPEVVHPLVRTHEETGKKAIYFNPNRTDRIVGMERAESDTLLDWVNEVVLRDAYRYDHKWRRGDVLVWDNRCLLHSVNMDFPVGQKRLHQRILLRGKRPR